jgi:SOS-response transcriptional repressor LexA
MLTQAELAEAVGCGQSLISYYELGEVRSVPFETIERLAAVLGKPVSYFTGEREEAEDELGVIRERVEQIYRALYDKIEPITVPIYGSVPASGWEDAVVDKVGDRIGVLPELEDVVDYALRVRGHSMSPTLFEGDIVYVSKRFEPKQRDIVVVRNRDGEVSLKRYIKFREKASLRPDNPDYDELELDEAEVLGIVVASLRRFR